MIVGILLWIFQNPFSTLFTALLALLVAMVVLAYSYTYIVFDSCGYETVKAIARMYPNISGSILLPWQLSTAPRGSIAVVLATNISTARASQIS